MKNYSYLTILFIGLLAWASCKDDNDGQLDAEYYRPMWEAVQVLGSLEATAIKYSEQGFGNEDALAKAADFMGNDPRVDEVTVFDSLYVYLTLSSGLEVTYALIPVDDNDQPITRGAGGNSGGLLKMLTGNSCSNDIANRKILLFNAEFITEPATKQILLDKAEELELEVTELRLEDCTYEAFTTFSDYGLVVINTHGLPNGLQLGTRLPTGIRDSAESLQAFAEQLNLNLDRCISDLINVQLQSRIIAKRRYKINVPLYQYTSLSEDADNLGIYVPGKIVAQQNLPNTIVFGNMCYSGFANTQSLNLDDVPILTAWEQANVLSYLGYQQTAGMSHSLSDAFAQKMERHVYEGLVNEVDSTGNVHLSDAGTEQYDTVWTNAPRFFIRVFGNLYFRQFFAEDYCYKNCGETLIDPRDSTAYKTVCIGNQVWMAENLNYAGGYCYDNNASNCDTYGRLYHWDQLMTNIWDTSSTVPSGIQGICPPGWHVPSYKEWEQMLIFIGGADFAARDLKATTSWNGGNPGTDAFGFSALGGGVGGTREILPVGFAGIGSTTTFWTSSIFLLDTSRTRAHAIRLRDIEDEIDVFANTNIIPADRGNAFYCRCVKD